MGGSSSESTSTTARRGDLAYPRRASQLRDSTGFAPGFALYAAPGNLSPRDWASVAPLPGTPTAF